MLLMSIAPGTEKFIATCSGYSISFLDIISFLRINPDIEDNNRIRSIALSPGSS